MQVVVDANASRDVAVEDGGIMVNPSSSHNNGEDWGTMPHYKRAFGDGDIMPTFADSPNLPFASATSVVDAKICVTPGVSPGGKRKKENGFVDAEHVY